MDKIHFKDIWNIGEFVGEIENLKTACKKFLPLHFILTKSLHIESKHDMFLNAFQSAITPSITTLCLFRMNSHEILHVSKKLPLTDLRTVLLEDCVIELDLVEDRNFFPSLVSLESFRLFDCEWSCSPSLMTALAAAPSDPDLLSNVNTTVSYQTEGGILSSCAQNHWDLFKCGQSLIVSLSRYCSGVKSLTFSGSKLASIWRPFANVFSSFTSILLAHSLPITFLDLDTNGLIDCHLSNMVKTPSLTHMSLVGNSLTDITLERILGACENTYVNLIGNKIQLASLDLQFKLLKFLETNPKAFFILDGNPIETCPVHPRIQFSLIETQPLVAKPENSPEKKNWNTFLEESCDEEDDESYTGASDGTSQSSDESDDSVMVSENELDGLLKDSCE